MNQSVQQRGSNAPKHTNFDRKWAWFTKISRARKRAHFCAPPHCKSWLRHCARLLAIPKGSRGHSFLSQVLLVILALLECVWSGLANWKDVELMGRFQPDG